MGKTNQKKEYDYHYRTPQEALSREESGKADSNEVALSKIEPDKTDSVVSADPFYQKEQPGESPSRKSRISMRRLSAKPPCGLHCIKMNDIGVKVGKSVIIEHVNLHIHCGKLTVIIGRNGAGKSTLIKAILGEIRHSGTVEFRDMRDRGIQDLRIGYVPQHLNIEKNTPTSVYDMFASYISNVPVFLRKSRRLEQKIADSLALFQAQELMDKQLCDLSGGELQRVLLSIACEPVPNLLLLDEPVSGIDQNGMELFYRNLAMLKKNYDLAMVLVSHDLDFVARYADSVILLDRTVLKEGSPEQVFSSAAFKEIFGNLRYGGIG